jgi:hypothetical protein
MASFSRILGQSLKSSISAILTNEILPFNFNLKFYWNSSFFHSEKIMRFKKWPQLPGAGRTRVGHHHGSHTPTSPEAVLLGKMFYHTKQICRQCIQVILKLNQEEKWLSNKSLISLKISTVCIFTDSFI